MVVELAHTSVSTPKKHPWVCGTRVNSETLLLIWALSYSSSAKRLVMNESKRLYSRRQLPRSSGVRSSCQPPAERVFNWGVYTKLTGHWCTLMLRCFRSRRRCVKGMNMLLGSSALGRDSMSKRESQAAVYQAVSLAQSRSIIILFTPTQI